MHSDIFNNYSKNDELNKIFYPKSIAVVGASNDINKIGGFIFSQIKDRDDLEAYPINNKEDNVQGKKAFGRLTQIKKPVDLVIIRIPSIFVMQSIDDLVMAGCKNVIIISAGFKETGSKGLELEDKVREIIKEKNLNLIGPNCLGILNAEIGLNCSFAKDVPEGGEIALVSQSGAVIDAIIDWSFKKRIEFSKIISLGNMAGIDELSILQYLKDDPKTKAIVFYMETLEKGKIFGEVLREISKEKPVIIIKPGNSDNAKAAIGSHTGSLAQDNVLVETLIRRNNGIYVENLNELFNVLIGLKSNYNSGKNLVIVTNAGGPGVIATDILAKSNFELYKFTQDEKDKLKFLPKEASLNNPVDILGDAKSNRYFDAIGEINLNPNVDNILVLLTPQIMTDCENISKAIVDIKGSTSKNLFSCFLGGKEIKGSNDYFDDNNFSNFSTPNDAIIAMSKLQTYKGFNYEEDYPDYSHENERIKELKVKLKDKKGILDYTLSKDILDSIGVNMPEKRIFDNRERLEHGLLEPDKLYVIKADGKKLVHKKELGAVETDIHMYDFNEKALAMWDRVAKKCEEFVITVEEQITGAECIIGLKEDQSLGRFIMFGSGGTYVNVYKDIIFETCPLSSQRVRSLVEKSKINEILKGYRGSKSIDYDNLYDILQRISTLQDVYPEIKEVDLNPIICNSEGIYLVDVKLLL